MYFTFDSWGTIRTRDRKLRETMHWFLEMTLVGSTVSSCLGCEHEGSLNCITHFVCEMILEETVMNTKVVDGCVL